MPGRLNIMQTLLLVILTFSIHAFALAIPSIQADEAYVDRLRFEGMSEGEITSHLLTRHPTPSIPISSSDDPSLRAEILSFMQSYMSRSPSQLHGSRHSTKVSFHAKRDRTGDINPGRIPYAQMEDMGRRIHHGSRRHIRRGSSDAMLPARIDNFVSSFMAGDEGSGFVNHIKRGLGLSTRLEEDEAPVLHPIRGTHWQT